MSLLLQCADQLWLLRLINDQDPDRAREWDGIHGVGS
jgi:hypothetical protein